MMKVLLMAWSVHDYAYEFAQAVGRQCPVTLVLARFRGADYRPPGPGVELLQWEWPRHRSWRNVLLLRQLRRLLRDSSPDIVHCLNADAVWLNWLFPRRRPYSWITTVHDIAYHPGDRSSRQVPSAFRRRFIRRSDAIIVHGESLRAQAAREFGLHPSRIGVLPHVGLFRYRQLAVRHGLKAPADGRLRVLFFGRIYAYKGLRYFMESEPLVRQALPHVRFIVAGEGEPFERYRPLMRDGSAFDIRNRRIPDEEVAQLFLEADVVVLPYVEASQSGVIPIAVTFGKPVIVTDVGELPALVREGAMGLVVPAQDAEALAQAIIRLGEDEALRRGLGQGAAATAATTLSYEAVGAQAVAFYARWHALREGRH